ncbi:hypothetical protein H2198_006657 [Neophaeococcomyces mojaviensis]|uniref:Uncharacterized protein n=1 Tax=Neophaeococcomyces mojaviensis TaxID=3383035 RepID=A0ACC3A299_9EURO|nr:hypothetical protein H2198_006657 [Knufia sp. JES_112]
MAIDPKKNVESALLNGDGETNKTEQKTLEGIQVNGCSKSDQATNGIDNNAVNGDNEPEVEKKESDAENKTKSKPVVRYDEYWDMRSFSWKLRKSAKPDKKRSKQNSIIVVRRRIDHKGRHFETAIDVHSPIVAQALEEINASVQRTKLKRTPPVADPQLLYHSLDELRKRLADEEAKTTPDAKVVEHLKVIVDFTEEEQAGDISSLKTLTAAGEMTWNLLWALFKPNTLAYHFHQLTEQHMVLLTRWTEIEKKCDGQYFRVACDVVNDDGVSFGLAKKIFEIKEFEGAARVQDLMAFPIEYHPDKENILKHAQTRAKRFVSMVGYQYKEISGSAMREIRSTRHEPREVRFWSFGKMIVDPKSFRLFEPDAEYNLSVYQSLDRDSITEEQLAICTPIVFGYCFGVKQWGGFALDRCSDVTWQNDAFQQLVLAQSRKSLVHSLVRQHKARKDTFDDVVQGKGKGLIGLLSGKPGSGKTLTAESISQLTRQPLYTVSAGELGEKPQEVDEKLTMILALAVTWDAVVLLDEADVFLQTRDDNNITRNALVSIFLRQLEYFEGILILTTNRIGNIDPAFESRIHFSFHYPDLDFNARKQIWMTFWKRAQGEGVQVSALSDENLSALAKHSLNGRQIKNTVASALSLALEEGSTLEKRHADTVLEVVESWDEAVAAQ